MVVVVVVVVVIVVVMVMVVAVVVILWTAVGGHERYGTIGEGKGEEGDWEGMAKGRRHATERGRERPPPTDTRSTCTSTIFRCVMMFSHC